VLGWVDADTRKPMSPFGASLAARDTWAVFDRLHVLPDRRPGETPGVTPPAAVRLARAALVGQPARTSTPSRRRTPGPAVELTVTLRDIEPPIWRRIVVPASLTLRELHGVIQTAMGWEDRHLYGFDVDRVLYTTIEDVHLRVLGDLDSFTVGEAADAATMFTYEYDYGDDWDHVIRVEQVLPSGEAGIPRVLDGARACPPEDCGGLPGYEQLLETLADEAHPRREEVLRWLGGEYDPEAFDLAATNANLGRFAHRARRRR
jgi:Plasmid pRiA4b ORF-3-like protein